MPASKVPRSIAGALPPPERYRGAAPFGRRPGIMAKRTNALACRLFLRPIIRGRSRGRVLTRGAFRMARPGSVGLLPGSAFRMPWALGCVWLMARRELGLARAALLCSALGKGRRG